MRGVHPLLAYYAEQLIALAALHGVQLRVTSTVRSRAQQTKLFRAYISGRSALPAAPPGKSKHEYGLAVDMTAPFLEQLNWAGQVWRSSGLTWGGSVDPVHFEL
jgi:LAS superfamily LD-carboxypeptidase LdcB